MARKPLPSLVMTDVPAAGPDPFGRPRRFLLAALSFTLLAALMSGCVIIKSNSSTQLEVIGKVQITTRFCASDTTNPPNNTGYPPNPPGDPTCQQHATGGNANAGGNSAGDAANVAAGGLQLMIAYRIPNLSTAPNTIVTTEPGGGSAITFTQSASYASELQAQPESAAPSGMKWVGYVSTATGYSPSTGQYFTVAPQFTLVQFLGVAPFNGPFNYRAAVGFRMVNGSFPATRPVDCGPDVFVLHDEDGQGGIGAGICADNPMEVDFANNLSQTTRDLGVIIPLNQSVQAGATANLPFILSYKGAALPSGQFNITATTNIPGATATPAITTLTPAANSDTNMNVSVPVPANTPPGSYNVNAIATLSTNPSQTRGTAVPATLTVGEAFGLSPAPTLPSLGAITLNGQAQTKTAQMNNFGVLDSPGSSDQGWNVTVVGDSGAGKSPVFKQYCPGPGNCGGHPPGYVSSGHTLSANSLTLNSSGANWSGGTPPAPSFQCNAGGCPIDSASPFKIASAPNGGGTGLWNATGFGASSLGLATPSTLRALPAGEQYKLDVVWTLNSGP